MYIVFITAILTGTVNRDTVPAVMLLLTAEPMIGTAADHRRPNKATLHLYGGSTVQPLAWEDCRYDGRGARHESVALHHVQRGYT